MAYPADRIRSAARDKFGFEALRPGQEEAIAAVVDGRDMLAVMATGYGKSAIYQVAAVLIDGPTVVVSPLIALQREQVTELASEDVGGAAAVSSLSSPRVRREEALEERGATSSSSSSWRPSNWPTPRCARTSPQAKPSLFVVDEAHCISRVGPRLPPRVPAAGRGRAGDRPARRSSALTATASPPVREEIVARLGMREPRAGGARIRPRRTCGWAPERFYDQRHKERALIEEVVEAAEAGDRLLRATRKGAEELAGELAEAGVAAAAYHAGLARKERSRVQERLRGRPRRGGGGNGGLRHGDRQGRRPLRLPRPDPPTRSTRSTRRWGGRPRWRARASPMLFYRARGPGPEALLRRGGPGRPRRDRARGRRVREGEPVRGGRAVAVEADLGHRASRGGRRRGGRTRAARCAAWISSDDKAQAAFEAQEHREEFDRSRVEMMQRYAELDRGCRREFVLSYFGEAYEGPCGNCDLCDDGAAEPRRRSRPFAVGSGVSHGEWGRGVVQRYEGDHMVVLFDASATRPSASYWSRSGAFSSPPTDSSVNAVGLARSHRRCNP